MEKLKRRKLERAKKFVLSSVGLAGSVVGLGAGLTGNPVALGVSVPLVIASANKFEEALKDKYIDNSLMKSDYNNYITENMPGIKQVLTLLNVKTEEQRNVFFALQGLRFYLSSDTLDKDGNPIKYSTHTQALVSTYLRTLRNKGFIDNYECNPSGKTSRLFFASLFMGNFKRMLSGKKAKMYNVSFTKTGKSMTEQDICEFLNLQPEELAKKFNISYDEQGNIKDVDYNIRELMKENWGPVSERIKSRLNSRKKTFNETLSEKVSDVYDNKLEMDTTTHNSQTLEER